MSNETGEWADVEDNFDPTITSGAEDDRPGEDVDEADVAQAPSLLPSEGVLNDDA